jgi:RNA recognition motif-containing protein
MESPELAQEAIAKLNNYELDGKKIKVSLFDESRSFLYLFCNCFSLR